MTDWATQQTRRVRIKSYLWMTAIMFVAAVVIMGCVLFAAKALEIL